MYTKKSKLWFGHIYKSLKNYTIILSFLQSLVTFHVSGGVLTSGKTKFATTLTLIALSLLRIGLTFLKYGLVALSVLA
jgi:hypothetical protein